MFERLKAAMSNRANGRERDAALVQWARDRSLDFGSVLGGGWTMSGRLLDRPFRAERAASTRDYIDGMAVLAKVDLGLRFDGSVVVMNRALKRALEAQANSLYSDVTDTVHTTAKALPEELRWLSMFRDAGWAGPENDFWRRYAVLTDAPEIARHWLAGEGVEQLMNWPPDGDEHMPVVLMLMRGKTYLRMGNAGRGHHGAALSMLGTFEHLSRRAVELFGR
jgi:hypothetical protein